MLSKLTEYINRVYLFGRAKKSCVLRLNHYTKISCFCAIHGRRIHREERYNGELRCKFNSV